MLRSPSNTSRISHGSGLYVAPDRKIPRAFHFPQGRALHLVDLENLMRGPLGSPSLLRQASELYRQAAPVNKGDHVVLATNPALTLEAGLAWPHVQLLIGRGPNGADLALVDQIQNVEWVASRFDRVVIGSGDGIFAPSVVALREKGIAVGIVAPEHGVSLQLERKANFLRLIPDLLDSKVVA